MNPNQTVIVIRSLVPGGVAQVDGQLIPGDRLLFVNDIGLENATLDQAVQALKGAPKGTVRIGVAKPLPIPDSIVQVSDQDDRIEPTTDDRDDNEAAVCSIMDSHKQRREYFRERKVNVIEPPHHMDLIEGLKHQHNLVKSESF
ncbi:patj homolog [Ceratina calcarata]|nr:patj homolog [Ceratina calcarata]